MSINLKRDMIIDDLLDFRNIAKSLGKSDDYLQAIDDVMKYMINET